MSYNLILNSSNVSSSNNTSFTYNFISGGLSIPPGSQMCVSQLNIPYAFFNISNYYNNLSFSYIWPYSNTTKTYTVTFPPGFYTITDIENYLQLYMISNNQYFTNTATGQNLFFISIVQNTTYYTNEIILNPIPTSLTNCNTIYSTGGPWVEPILGFNDNNSVDYGYPNTDYCAQVVISSVNNFGSIIGFTPGTYPNNQTTIAQNILGNTVPNATPVNSLILLCSLVNNDCASPSNVLDSFSINATFGSSIIYTPNFEKYVDIVAGHYKTINFQIVDQNYNTIYSLDPNVLLNLIIKLGKK